jgi:Ni2+-binding GTPase involved in maturation of urease and hydrogenase
MKTDAAKVRGDKAHLFTDLSRNVGVDEIVSFLCRKSGFE